MKDLFSNVSDAYSRFRPEYPSGLFQFLRTEIKEVDIAWDCGTGTGQIAIPLSRIFTRVHATDISEQQLQNAPRRENIIYSLKPAEKTDFDPEMFDLITVGKAIHWYDFDEFFFEVNRTLKPDGLIAVLGYGLITTDPATQETINHLYFNLLGPYWDPERKFIDENYNTIPFPFLEINTPDFTIAVNWNIDELLGYLRTWSAVQHYIAATGDDPLKNLLPKLRRTFGNGGEVTFPVLFRLGKKN